MTIEWRRRALYITWLPVASMGRLAACAPQTGEEHEVLAALLAGARVCLGREALEYRRCRKTAPREIYARLTSLERRLREMGIGYPQRERALPGGLLPQGPTFSSWRK